MISSSKYKDVHNSFKTVDDDVGDVISDQWQ